MEADSALLAVSHGGPEEISMQIIQRKPAESLDPDNCYLMNRVCRGKAIIFNNDELEEGDTDARPNSAKDVETLVATFKMLGLQDDDIDVKSNLKFQEIEDHLKQVSAEDYTNVDCLIVAFLSLRTRNFADQDEKLWNSFTSEHCKSLAEKPKIFFIQACRSKRVLRVETMVTKRSCFGVCGYVICGVVIGGVVCRAMTGAIFGAVACGVGGHYLGGQNFSIVGTFVGLVMGGIGGALFGDDGFVGEYHEDVENAVPKEADFLIAHSSPKDMESSWDPKNGTWFIQSLCQELQASASASASGSASASRVNLLDVMTRTARRVTSDDAAGDDVVRVKQVPSIASTLTKNIFFPATEP